MGIPKFFRYISERYPLTSQLIQEKKIPEFDNLYLDFNGIIHNCSHPNDADPHFRLTEEQIFTSIFAYVDHLFATIRPQKLFFLAVDGVAPRAKMNQQRARRFRTSRDARELREKALRKGEKLPAEDAFDSNCITPGTSFMTRLSSQLHYFIHKKITEDAHWRAVRVVLSGHEVPGEGEHKIMEYIRLARAQPDYDPNIRHCLYGLDADLIMLGLLSHDPHFCLLREEVKFGPAARKRGGNSLESINFYLLHLSLMREYLDLEFHAIAPVLPFPYSLERVIDDFILLAVFVGNDFLPNLPDLHIHENGLERLFEVYKQALPRLDGYLNESGTIQTTRLQVVLDEMSRWEQEVFEREYADVNWFKGKQAEYADGGERTAGKVKGQLVLTQSQRTIFEKVQAFVLAKLSPFPSHPPSARTPPNSQVSARLVFQNTYAARDRHFISELAEALGVLVAWDEYDGEKNLIVLRVPWVRAERRRLSTGLGEGDELDGVEEVLGESLGQGLGGEEGEGEGGEAEDGVWEDVDDNDEDEDNLGDGSGSQGRDRRGGSKEGRASASGSGDDSDGESRVAVLRVLKKYEAARVLEPDEAGAFDARASQSGRERMDGWKRGYYQGKLEISYDDPQAMAALTFRYVEGLQWVMHYYYSGVASWSWFYDYHYAPRISDLRGVDKMTFQFDLGRPFYPFEQLMGVLPEASKELIPLAYRDLMYDPNSPILDFYPVEFGLDLNGKKQDWEAVVKIPFINEKRLLKAMTSREHRLTPEERKRNSFSTSTRFSYNPGTPTVYPSSLPGFFPALHHCRCTAEPFDLPTLDGLHLVKGLCDGVFLGTAALAGFPSLNTLPHTAQLGFHGVNVHGAESRNHSMVVSVGNPHEGRTAPDLAREMVGGRVFVGWPFLREGLVVAVSDARGRYEKMGGGGRVVSTPHAGQGFGMWRTKAERIEQVYSKRCGVLTGSVDVLLHVRALKGLRRMETGAFVKDYDTADRETEHAVQMAVAEVTSEDPRFLERDAPPLSEEFPEGSKIFFLGEHAYGVAAQVSATTETTLSVILAFFPSDKAENEEFRSIVDRRLSSAYYPSFRAAEMVGISGLALSKITSSFMVITADNQKTNLGLSLKFDAKALKVIDYSRKGPRHWEFSEKAVELIREYKNTFPEIFKQLDCVGDAMAKVSEVLRGPDHDARLKEVKAWLKSRGVRDFEPVSLYCDILTKEIVSEIEEYADSLSATRAPSAFKKAIVKGIPRQAVLKPSHAVYRLQNQRFALGDRVTMVQDSGGVPLSVKGVVIGLNSKSMDVIWDAAFVSGVTLGDRCSQYRGSTVEFNTCLNLSNPQFVASTNPKAQAPPPSTPFQPRIGPRPVIQPPPGQQAASGFRPNLASRGLPMHIMANPNRGVRGGFASGRGGPSGSNRALPAPAPIATTAAADVAPAAAVATPPPVQPNGIHAAARGGLNPRGGVPNGYHHPPRGGFVPGFRGRGGFVFGLERGRGTPRGFRGGRGRGFAPPLAG